MEVRLPRRIFLYQMIAETGKETAILLYCYSSYESDLKLMVSFYVISE